MLRLKVVYKPLEERTLNGYKIAFWYNFYPLSNNTPFIQFRRIRYSNPNFNVTCKTISATTIAFTPRRHNWIPARIKSQQCTIYRNDISSPIPLSDIQFFITLLFFHVIFPFSKYFNCPFSLFHSLNSEIKYNFAQILKRVHRDKNSFFD